MTQKKLLHPRSCLECNVFLALPAIYVTDNKIHTNNISYDHEEKNNRQIMNELNVLYQHLFDYNRKTFEKFIQDIKKK